MRALATTVADVTACGLVVAGVALIFVPAALIVGGVLTAVVSYRVAGR
jgi:hypothetical protein